MTFARQSDSHRDTYPRPLFSALCVCKPEASLLNIVLPLDLSKKLDGKTMVPSCWVQKASFTPGCMQKTGLLDWHQSPLGCVSVLTRWLLGSLPIYFGSW